MRIAKKYTIVYNKAINKTKQPNNSKSCEAENHIPVRGQAVSPIVRKMSPPVVTIKEKGILNMCRTMNELEKVVADYRSLTTLLDEVTAQVEDLKREIIGYLDSKRVLPNGFSFSDVPTGLEVSSDPIEDWQWYHCHDVKYWGMKEINGKNYPTYTLFDNNYWTSESYGDSAIQNPRNNYMNNPKCNGWSYESTNGNDEDYKAKTVSRIIQISIDWDNSKIVDYKVYEIPEYFSQEMCGATMLNEGILALAFSYMGVWGVYDFISEIGTTTIQTDKIYKGAKKLFEAKYDTLRYCYRSNIYKLK